MRLLFKQRLFSWFDSYDIYNESGEVLFTVKGELSWGHLLRIYDAFGKEIGSIQERVLTFLPKFDIYMNGNYAGCIKKDFTFFRPRFTVDFNGWHVEGDWFEWDYTVKNGLGTTVASVSKEIFNWTDTYVIDVYDSENIIGALMLVLAIDAEKCSRKN